MHDKQKAAKWRGIPNSDYIEQRYVTSVRAAHLINIKPILLQAGSAILAYLNGMSSLWRVPSKQLN